MKNNSPEQGNFWFLTEFPLLQNIAQSAEYYIYSDPTVSLSKQRFFVEKVTELLFSEHFIEHAYDDSLHNRLRILKQEGVLRDHKIKTCFYKIKDQGNLAIHNGKGSVNDAISSLMNAYRIAKWLVEVYGELDSPLPRGFKKPENLDARHALHLLQSDFAALEEKYKAQLQTIQELSQQKTQQEKEALKAKAYAVSTNIPLTEAETRENIDLQLRNVGWLVNSKTMTYAKGERPEKGKNKAISEWKVNGGRADYALFIGEQFYGVIEAKKKSKEVLSDMTQAKRYARNADQKHGGLFLGTFGDYHTPFLFTTNSTFDNYQFPNRSGTWFLDARKRTNHPVALKNWFSPQDLKELYDKDIAQAIQNLQTQDDTFLTDKNGLNLRYYQIEAVKAIEKTVAIDGINRALLAMATGTGKTRTVMGICYRLLKSKRYKRILFLVDRTLLGTQAADTFKDTVIEDLETFANIYDIKEIKEAKAELDTKVHFATVQGMYRRIFDNADDTKVPSIGTYDCIIIDEAHRGYNLDRQMDEEEQLFKDESDYRSKYRQVIDYFEAFRIGLTATPAPHTISIFGRPVYEYGYAKAVIDGYLIGYQPPYIIRTELNQDGITWKKGENIKVYNRQTREIEQLEDIEDEVTVEVAGFNKRVLTESFNKTVLRELTNYIDPDGPDKTLIFAASDNHAMDLVQWFKEIFTEEGVEVDDDAIKKITGTSDKPHELVQFFKNERLPTIAITVDLLTTGIDVPKISNIVFLRRVNSRILYEQMLGRATRLCPEIGKESFRIFDAVGVYQNLENYTNMKPTVTSPKMNLSDLVDEFPAIDAIERKESRVLAQEKQIEQLLNKLNRKKRSMTSQQEEDFQQISGGISSDDFVRDIREKERDNSIDYIQNNKKLFLFLDEMRGVPQYQLISEHDDQLINVMRDYEVTYEANDYLQQFRTYILENRNKLAALEVICTRPQSLKREDLKALLLELKLAKFDTKHLDTAWKKANNETIAADIISYIRTLAMGSPLISHEERIRNAMRKVRQMQEWNVKQERWLKQFEKQLLRENILHKEDLDKGIFKREHGGYARIKKMFGDELDSVLKQINENLYA